MFSCFCAADPFPAKRKREEAKFKKFKKPNTSLKRDIPRQNLSLQNDSNTRARIKQQQQEHNNEEEEVLSEREQLFWFSFEEEEAQRRRICCLFFL